MVMFADRIAAGEVLADKFFSTKPKFSDPVVLGIPRGGLPIGHCIAQKLGAPLDTVVLRKLPIPDNPESGFGAVTSDKSVIFNKSILSYLALDDSEIKKIVDDVHIEVLRREAIYRRGRPFPELQERSVILTDDGLATGITMLAAVRFVRARRPKEIIVAVPVAHHEAYNVIRQEADKVFTLHISDLPYFAVASFYVEFPDMEDQEVIFYLDQYYK